MGIKRFFLLLPALALTLLCVSGVALAGPTPFGAFSAEDLRGEEPVTEAIFAEADLTIVNFWATWCGPCVAELPELARLKALSEGRAQVLGVLLDALDTKGRKDSLAIEAMHLLLDHAEADYPVVVPDEWIMRMASLVFAVPTTFLVNHEGDIVATIVGSRTAEQWLQAVDEALAAE